MEPIKLNVERRDTRGKRANAELRIGGKIPAVVYGPKTEPLALMLNPAELQKLLDNPYRRNSIFEMDAGAEKIHAMLKDTQYHPVTRKLVHVDFYAVDTKDPIHFSIPLNLTGKCIGVVKGGTLYKLRRTIDISCLASKLPESVTIDVTDLEVNQHRTVADLPAIDGVTYEHRPNTIVVQVKMAGAEEETRPAATEAAAAAAPADAKAGDAKKAEPKKAEPKKEEKKGK